MKRRTVILGAAVGLAGTIGAGGLVGYRLGQLGPSGPLDPAELFAKNPEVDFSRLSEETLTKFLTGRLKDRNRRAVERQLIRHNRHLFAEEIIDRVPGKPGFFSVG